MPVLTNRDSYSYLLHKGFVRGQLSSDTIGYIHDNGVIQLARTLTAAQGGAVFSEPESETSSTFKLDEARKMRYFSNLAAMNKQPVLKEAVRRILRDVKSHGIFSIGTGKVKSKLTCRLDLDQAAISFMIDGKINQTPHTDYNSKQINKIISNTNKETREQMPLLLLLAFEDNTALGYYPNLHNSFVDSASSVPSATQRMKLDLNSFEFVIFHPLFVHFGVSYTVPNVRVHLYLDSPLCKRQQWRDGVTKTYPILIGNRESPYGAADIDESSNVKALFASKARAKRAQKSNIIFNTITSESKKAKMSTDSNETSKLEGEHINSHL